MIYATATYQGTNQLFCIDKAGKRAFMLSDFFIKEIGLETYPKTMIEFIQGYEDIWTDNIALYFGRSPELAIAFDELSFHAPIPVPARNIVCLGKNYAAHAEELKGQIFNEKLPQYPIYFTKPDHTVIGHEDSILLHSEISSMIDYEVELAVIIGKKGIDIPKEKAEEYIFGYTIAVDVSARDLQRQHTQWYKGKSLISHCPMGPWIVHKSALPFPVSLDISCHINEELRQSANTSDLIFDIPTIISDLSRGYPLYPGDIILTGTPAGVGMGFDPPRYLKSGDRVVCKIQGIGTLINYVKD